MEKEIFLESRRKNWHRIRQCISKRERERGRNIVESRYTLVSIVVEIYHEAKLVDGHEIGNGVELEHSTGDNTR